MQECPLGTYKNTTGSDSALCNNCPSEELPDRALYIYVRGTFKCLLSMHFSRFYFPTHYKQLNFVSPPFLTLNYPYWHPIKIVLCTIIYIYFTGGVTETPCPYKCVSDRYHMPHCYTTLEELIYTFGGPWLFGFILLSVLIVLALVLSVARMKFAGGDELQCVVPSRRSSTIDRSLPFLESLNEVPKLCCIFHQ